MRAKRNLAHAKVAELNQKLREIELLKTDPDCPPTVLAFGKSGPIFIRVDHDAAQSTQINHLEITLKTEL